LLSLSRLEWLNLIGNLSFHGTGSYNDLALSACTKAPARALCNYQLRRSYFIVATAGSRLKNLIYSIGHAPAQYLN